MNTKILYVFTRTPLHVGSGSSVGAIDQPVQRERHTGFPIIPGSSIKGVIADQPDFLQKNGDGRWERTERGRNVLGDERPDREDAKSGSVSFGEGRLLAFPVRSGRGSFAWITSPIALLRWKRDCEINRELPVLDIGPEEGRFSPELGEEAALFEDYTFKRAGDFPEEWLQAIEAHSREVDTVWSGRIEKHLALVSDETLSFFARNACEVAQHVVIDDETGAAKRGLLFNQENVPSETLFYSVVTSLRPGGIDGLEIAPALQFGANATTGLGYCSTLLK